MQTYKIESFISPKSRRIRNANTLKENTIGPNKKYHRTYRPFSRVMARIMAKRVYAVAIFFPDNKYCRYKSGLDCEIRTTGMGIPVRKLLTKTVFYEMEIYDSAYTDWADPSGKMYQLFFTRIR